jgi:hypothetical protein
VATPRTRIDALEAAVKELHNLISLGATYGPKVSSETLYRMWQAEREDNIRLRILLLERERAHETFRGLVEAGLQALYDRAAEISVRLAGRPFLSEDDRMVEKFRSELRKGLEGQHGH